MSDIKILEQRAREIRSRYNELELKRDGKPWNARKLAEGFRNDVNELIEILQKSPPDEKKLNHELADCLWSVLVIARAANVDIEKAFWTTMGELDKRLDGLLNES
ncbi:MAG TPA: MazG nucleotide pyrophosphohydrolase domain-containing protein [Candidatus Saccharimonadales bacterium]|nr:MazG nucleotide pyrophosphohydrolase domain-containing protein [Candidatus Saccharimonadales bacterium]